MKPKYTNYNDTRMLQKKVVETGLAISLVVEKDDRVCT